MVGPAQRRAASPPGCGRCFLTRHTADVVVTVIDRGDDLGREVLRAWDLAGEELGEFDPGREGWLRPPSPSPMP
ncbi:GNAT family N-acetyltransferase OS=Streptomyces alboniger OX=132473 GN=CP975_18760 PE=4 SV=1 [Streptomyces alboniger]